MQKKKQLQMCSKHVLRDVLKFRSVVYNRAHGAAFHVGGGGDPSLLKCSWRGGGCGGVDFKNDLPGADSISLIIFFKTRKE